MWGVPVFVGGKPLVGGDTRIVISDVFGDLLTDYRCRWAIETLFQALKRRGFDLEATPVTNSERLPVAGPVGAGLCLVLSGRARHRR